MSHGATFNEMADVFRKILGMISGAFQCLSHQKYLHT
jgi:hypothetical protein